MGKIAVVPKKKGDSSRKKRITERERQLEREGDRRYRCFVDLTIRQLDINRCVGSECCFSCSVYCKKFLQWQHWSGYLEVGKDHNYNNVGNEKKK